MQLVLVIALLVAMGSFVTAAPAVAVGGDDNMCEPFTRSNLGPPPAATTTTTAIDLVDGGRARGGAGDAEAPGDDTAVIDDPPTTRPPRNCAPFVYEMEFPLLGAGAYWSGFGAPRDGGRRSHMGVDIAAPQMTPVVAVADGMVSRINIDSGTAGTYIALDHDDDWSSWYLHLNNDHYGTDDGRGIGVRPDLEAGDRVTAGEVIGWVGDSGNAETTEPHLHFEVHLPSGEPIDPYDSLLAAEADGAAAFVIDPTQVLTEQTEAGGTIDLVSSRIDTAAPRPGFAGPFVDDDGTAAEAAFNRLAALGARAWCDEWGVRVCPESEVTGADAEAWIEALVGTSRDPSVAIAYQPTASRPLLEPERDRGMRHQHPLRRSTGQLRRGGSDDHRGDRRYERVVSGRRCIHPHEDRCRRMWRAPERRPHPDEGGVRRAAAAGDRHRTALEQLWSALLTRTWPRPSAL